MKINFYKPKGQPILLLEGIHPSLALFASMIKILVNRKLSLGSNGIQAKMITPKQHNTA